MISDKESIPSHGQCNEQQGDSENLLDSVREYGLKTKSDQKNFTLSKNISTLMIT